MRDRCPALTAVPRSACRSTERNTRAHCPDTAVTASMSLSLSTCTTLPIAAMIASARVRSVSLVLSLANTPDTPSRMQCGLIRHDANDRQIAAEPRVDAVDLRAGSDGHDQRPSCLHGLGAAARKRPRMTCGLTANTNVPCGRGDIGVVGHHHDTLVAVPSVRSRASVASGSATNSSSAWVHRSEIRPPIDGACHVAATDESSFFIVVSHCLGPNTSRANTHDRRAFCDRGVVVGTHAHRQSIVVSMPSRDKRSANDRRRRKGSRWASKPCRIAGRHMSPRNSSLGSTATARAKLGQGLNGETPDLAASSSMLTCRQTFRGGRSSRAVARSGAARASGGRYCEPSQSARRRRVFYSFAGGR